LGIVFWRFVLPAGDVDEIRSRVVPLAEHRA